MKKLLPLLSLVFVLSSCGQEQNNINLTDNSQASISNKQRQALDKNFTVATYDIKTFFTKYNRDNVKQLDLSKVIHNLKSDLISFQGVSSANELKNFNDRYLKKGRN